MLSLEQQQQQQGIRLQQLLPRCRHQANSMKHNVVNDSALRAPLCESVTS